MSQYVEGPNTGLVIEDHAQLIEYFFQAAKPREDWYIGTEYEMPGESGTVGPDSTYPPKPYGKIRKRYLSAALSLPQGKSSHYSSLTLYTPRGQFLRDRAEHHRR